MKYDLGFTSPSRFSVSASVSNAIPVRSRSSLSTASFGTAGKRAIRSSTSSVRVADAAALTADTLARAARAGRIRPAGRRAVRAEVAAEGLLDAGDDLERADHRLAAGVLRDPAEVVRRDGLAVRVEPDPPRRGVELEGRERGDELGARLAVRSLQRFERGLDAVPVRERELVERRGGGDPRKRLREGGDVRLLRPGRPGRERAGGDEPGRVGRDLGEQD